MTKSAGPELGTGLDLLEKVYKMCIQNMSKLSTYLPEESIACNQLINTEKAGEFQDMQRLAVI